MTKLLCQGLECRYLVRLTARDDIWALVFGAMVLWSSLSNFVQMLIKLFWVKLDILANTMYKGNLIFYYNFLLPRTPSNPTVNTVPFVKWLPPDLQYSLTSVQRTLL